MPTLIRNYVVKELYMELINYLLEVRGSQGPLWENRGKRKRFVASTMWAIPLRLRTHMPFGREGEGLHLPSVPEALNRRHPSFAWTGVFGR